jgi:LacI family transcriptional regulator, repressor for deo operon, udp, cdd, tsx, nupC, and nupG
MQESMCIVANCGFPRQHIDVAVTLRDVAARAGVSARTVSNVVNGFQYVSPQMRTRVQTALDELDYRPNLLARSLRQGRTGVIALLVPEIAVPYFSELAHRVIETARPYGWTVLVDESAGESAREREALDVLTASGRVDGVLFSALGLGGTSLACLQPKAPVVLLGEHTADLRFDHVGIDNVAAARDVVAHLIAGGRRRVAAIGHDERMHSATSMLRLNGWRIALESVGLHPDSDLLGATEMFSRRAGYDAMWRLLPARPDAVFCLNDQLALGALRALREARARVPEDVAVAGFDDIDEAQYSSPPLTSLHPDTDAIAAEALRMVGERIAHNDRAPRNMIVNHALIVRESSARR